MSWFKPKPKVQIKLVNAASLTMRQWRSSPELVDYMRRLLATPQFQTVLTVLRNESPSSFGLTLGSTHDDQIAHAYKGTGYNLCLNNLEAMGIEEAKPEALEATFGPEPPNPLTSELESRYPEPPLSR